MNGRERTGAETLRGLPSPRRRSSPQREKVERPPIETPGRRSIRTGLPCGTTKRAGGFPAKSGKRQPPTGPGREKPRGASGGRRANHTFDREELPEGSKPSNRRLGGGLAASAAGIPRGETVGGFVWAETSSQPSVRRKLRRVNPRSAARMRQGGQGLEGCKPSGG